MNQPASILVVDDTPANLEVVEAALTPCGYRLRLAPGGRLGLRAAFDETPDLVLLDILMPDLNGFEVLRALRADARTAHVPVILLTALGAADAEEKGLALGAIDFIAKPLRVPLLQARVRVHIELKRNRDQLEARVRERTRELNDTNTQLMREIAEHRASVAERDRLEARLRQAHKLEAVGVFAAGIAHDFKNILGSVMLNAEIVRDSRDDDSAPRRAAEKILSASRRGVELISQILAFSGAGAPQKQWVDIGEILREARALVDNKLSGGPEIRLEIKDGLPAISADPVKLLRVFTNILANATRAMTDRPGAIIVAASIAPPAGDAADRFLEISFADAGPGMPPEVLERLFEPFFTTEAARGGTGMGMAVAHGIVEAHLGRIVAESRPGEGTLITVSLPLRL